MKKGIYNDYLKKQKKHMSPYYFLFNMSSYRKPEIQNDLPKITKIKFISCAFNEQWLNVYFIIL